MRTISRVDNANDVVLEYVKRIVEERSFTGQIVIHCNRGVMRKTEDIGVVTTERLLTELRST